MKLPPHRLCNLIDVHMMARLKPEERDRYEMEMEMPLPGETKKAALPPKATEVSDDGALFMAAMESATFDS